MKKLWFITGWLLLVTLPTLAQESPKVEVFGGYSNVLGDLHGWNASVAGNLNCWAGLVADFSGHYSKLNEDGATEKIRTHTFLFGPQFSLRRSRVVPFTHVLLGTARIKAEATELGRIFTFSDTTFGLAVGGGLDIGLNQHIALRAFQADYLRTRLFNETQHTARLSFGLVIRLGRR